MIKDSNSHTTIRQVRDGFLPVLYHQTPGGAGEDNGFKAVIPGMYPVLDRNFAVRQAQSWASALGIRCTAKSEKAA